MLEKLKIVEMKAICSHFEGTHYFHNFTSEGRYKLPSLQRFIKQFDVELKSLEPNIFYLEFKVIGNSFLYHQIRKMIGCVFETYFSENKRIFYGNDSVFDLGNKGVNFPLAPSEGLFLSNILFFDQILKMGEKPLRRKESFEENVVMKEIFYHDKEVFCGWLSENFCEYLSL